MAGVVCGILFRLVLPLIILVCVIFRPCLVSGIYLLLMLFSAMVPVPTCASMKGSTGLFLKFLIIISTITSLCQITFQVLMLLLFKPYGNILENCEFLEKILRHSGFVKLNRLDVASVFLWVTPEAIMFISSIIFYIMFSKLTKSIPIEQEEENIGLRSSSEGIAKKKDNKKIFVALGKYLVITALCISGILKPSVLNGFYFLVFLSSATWWSCYKTLEKGFGIVLKICMVFVSLHIFTLYTYQTDWPKEYVEINSTYARYFGLSSFMNIDCQEPRRFLYDILPWYDYVNFLFLFILFFLMAVESKYLLQPKPPKKQGTFSRLEGSFKGPLSRQLSQRLSDKRLRRSGTTRNRWQSATRKVRDYLGRTLIPASETSPLLHSVTSSNQRYGINVKGPAILQDSTGSMIITSENPDEIQLSDVSEVILENEENSSTCFDKTIYVLESILLFVIKTSYIETNIIMMTWSITYHSWLTFVLLLWASGLWMLPNQRKFMLRLSPFLVLYALFLLISAYIYSMDLTEAELPTKINNIDLVQIGFVRNTVDPCKQLIVKCLFTTMFWITLRQYTKERKERRQNSALADMVAPLQLSVGTATGIDHVAHIIAEGQKCKKKVYPEKLGEQAYLAVSLEQTDNIDDSKHSSGITKDQEEGNQVLTKIGNFVRKLLTQFWIWIVAITLFGVAITGERMTSFRILYMALFLVFILTFQFSFNAWRRMMFGFWLTVIIYSMLILVMVYTYQFDNFPKYWETYLHVSLEQQLDIGLEKYETKQLFVRLVTPTFFVIITVIQLHYFHKDFMELSKPIQNAVVDTAKSEANSSAQGGVNLAEEDDEDKEEDVKSNHSQDLNDTDMESVVISSKQLKKKFERFLIFMQKVFNYFLLFLEIHMPKFVMLMTMLVCVMDVAAINIILVILLVLGATLGKSMMRITIYISSLIVSVMLLARMVYQIQYIQHDMWNVACPVVDTNETSINITGNNAEWLGFNKTSENKKLPELVKWNIGHILVVTIWCIINVRQRNYRAKHGDVERAFFMFPDITITNANKNLCNFLKYLANYFFYRLGVEICLIATVATISLRMDLYALLYAIWLAILVLVERKKLEKIWNFFLIFIAVFIPIQYFMVIGLPPGCCLVYPWDYSEILRSVQEWAFLMDPISPPPSKKLLCDFCLLILVARQSLVFRIEKRYQTSNYSGGSNESIIHNAENNDFNIPVPDFITYNRTYLDILKKTVFLPFMWVTLAIVFLAGANRVNLFSLGYLLGSFYFLWQGSDIYLKPIHKILKGWNALITYNVIVIIIKVILQLIGCVFFDYMETHACWFIQLLGISCLRKFKVVAYILPQDENECTVPREYIGLAWDGACFAFLYLQRRIFQSYNFFHVINEAKASAILASRGAELIEELRYKRMRDQDEAERKIIEKIKMKMDRIKENQKKILGPNYKDPTSHYVEPPLARSSSMASCTSGTSQQTTTPGGYHTPIDDDEDGDPAPLTPAAGSLIQPNAPSPYSAITTGCLEGYLEPQRMSFSSPPNSELNPRPPSPDDSFPVFSPPPYDDAPPYAEAVSEPTTVVQRNQTIGPPWMAGSLITPRQSVMSYSTRSPMSHHTYTVYPNSNRPLYRRYDPDSYKRAVRSGDYYMFDDVDQEELDVFEDEELSEEGSSYNVKKPKPSLSQLLHKTLKTDVSTALKTSQPSRRLSLQYKPSATRERRTSLPFSAPPTVEIHEPEEPTPGPSQPKEEDEMYEISEAPKIEEKKRHCCEKFLECLLFVWVLIESVMITIINYLNKQSRDYRYVMRVLTKEKRILKEKTKYNVGTRTGLHDIWIPSYTYRELLLQQRIMDKHSNEKLVTGNESVISASALPHSDEKESVQQVNFLEEMEGAELSSYDQPTIIRLLLAIWYIILSHSDMLCYFIIFLNQIKNATSISLPLPLMVFFWGTLTIPRPSKIFWITIIAYTQIIVLLKCVLQFPLLPWNDESLPKQHKIASVIGIERKKDFAFWDLLLLLVVFFHRFMLKCLGLWKTTGPVPVALLPEGEYTIVNGELVPKFEVNKVKSKTKKHRPRLRFEITSSENDIHENIVTTKRASKSFYYRNTANKFILSKSGLMIWQKNQKVGTDLEQLVDESDGDQDVKLIANEVEPSTMLPSSLRLVVPKYHQAFILFFQQLFDPTSRVAADVYSFMFLCDFFNFFVLLFGYSSFGSQQSDGDGGVASYLKNNRVPVLFLILLIIQFLIIITDRAIFLRKNITAKIIFQFLQIFMLHLWLFVIYPISTDRSVNSVIAPQMYYMVKCFYLLLSAYQIRCGYPTRILGNFLCKGFGYLNLFLFKGFMFIPFLFELRTIMDWMWTDTSMTVFDWIKMEDIFAHIYQLKCTRHIENEYPQPRGERKRPLVKYAMGGGLLAIIIAVVWFPLVFFSLGNTVGKPNPPYDVTIDLRLGPYEPLYRMSAQSNSIFQFSINNYGMLEQRYVAKPRALNFLSDYEFGDIAAIKLSSDSATVWSISPPDLQRMIEEVASENTLELQLLYQISHKSNTKEDPGVVREKVTLSIEPSTLDKPNPIRQQLLEMLQNHTTVTKPVLLTYLMPKFIKVTNRGTTEIITELMDVTFMDKRSSSLRNMTLLLARDNDKLWWEIKEVCDDYNYIKYLQNIPYADCSSFMMYTFSDKIFPATLNIITGGGIIGLYTTLVFVASRVLRGFFSEICFKIMFDDMPCVDRVLQLTLDIYLVREAGEFALEEDLFAKLVFLYRSPETLIKWTRPIEEAEDEDDPEGNGQNN